jgi:hypothetical protein
VPYNLDPGTSSDPITVRGNFPVFIIGTNITVGDRGTGFISLESDDRAGGITMFWTGVNSGGGIASGASVTAGAAMLLVDPAGQVTVQTAGVDQIVVHNGSGAVATGFLWILTAPI